MLRASLLGLGLAAVVGGCGGSADTTATQSGQGSVITSFDVRLKKPGVARVSYALARPARLTLSVNGIRNGSKRNQPSGRLPVAPPGRGPGSGRSAAAFGPVSPAGSDATTVDFEQGEFDFTQSPQVRFTLVALTPGGTRDRSRSVTTTPGH